MRSFLILLILPLLSFSYSLKCFRVGEVPLRFWEGKGVFTIVDSLHGKVFSLIGNEVFKMEGFKFPVWAIYAGGSYYVSDIKAGKVFKISKKGKVERSLSLPRPEMIKIHNGRIYVSSGRSLYEISKDLKILRRWTFEARSVYFYFKNDLLLWLNYWKEKNMSDVQVIDLKSGKEVRKIRANLSRPFRFMEIGKGRSVLLDYGSGDLVILENLSPIKRIDLPRFSYGLTFFKGKILVSNLSKNFIYVVDPDSFSVRRIKTPHPFADLAVFGENVAAAAIFNGEVTIMNLQGEVVYRKRCSYPVMLKRIQNGVAFLCSDDGKICLLNGE